MEWSSIQISFPPIPTPAPSKTTSTGLAYHTAVKMKGRMVVVGGLIEGKSCFLGPLFLNLSAHLNYFVCNSIQQLVNGS